MTNGDKIRSMTDEELVDFLTFGESCVCSHCKYNTDDTGCIGAIICHKDHVQDVFRKWLSSEYVPGSVDGGERKCLNLLKISL